MVVIYASFFKVISFPFFFPQFFMFLLRFSLILSSQNKVWFSTLLLPQPNSTLSVIQSHLWFTSPELKFNSPWNLLHIVWFICVEPYRTQDKLQFYLILFQTEWLVIVHMQIWSCTENFNCFIKINVRGFWVMTAPIFLNGLIYLFIYFLQVWCKSFFLTHFL